MKKLNELIDELKAAAELIAQRQAADLVKLDEFRLLQNERKEQLDARELAIGNREKNIANLRCELAVARTAKAAAVDRETKLAAKYADLSKRFQASQNELGRIRVLVPHLFQPITAAVLTGEPQPAVVDEN